MTHRIALLLALGAVPAFPLDFTPAANTIAPGSTVLYFTPTGGTGPYSFAITGAPIPGFRVLATQADLPASAPSAARGALVGVATPGTYSTTITVTDLGAGGQQLSKTYTLTVNPLAIMGFVPNRGLGDTYNTKLSGVGGMAPYSFAVVSGALPTGLNLDPDGSLTGTTMAAGSFGFGVRITDANATANTYNMGATISPMRLSSHPTRTLPNGNVNLAYSQTLTVVGGSGVYTFSLVPGSTLPTGLSLSSTGVISGTPTASAFASHPEIVIRDNTAPTPNTLRVILAISILPTSPVSLSITTSELPDVEFGANNTAGIHASGGVPPYTFSIAGPVPADTELVSCASMGSLDWNVQCGTLRRRHMSLGMKSFVAQITDSVGNVATRPLQYKVGSIAMLHRYIPISGGPVPVVGQFFAQNLIPMGGVPPYAVTPIRMPIGMSLSSTGVLSGTPMENGRYLDMDYVLTDSTGSASAVTEYGHLDVQSSGTTTTLTLSGRSHRLLQKGNNFSLSLNASGSPLSTPNYDVNPVSGFCNLPPGLRLLKGSDFNNNNNANTVAQIAGASSTAGDYACLLELTDAAGNRGRTNYTFHVSSLSFVTTGFASAYVGQGYSQTIDVRGGTPPYTFKLSSGPLPGGFTFDSNTGVIGGIPTSVGSLSVTVEVRSGVDTLTRTFTLNTYPFQIANPDVLPNATLGINYSTTFTTIGGTGPFTWTGTGIPSGLTLSTSGVLSGKLTAFGVAAMTITASNGTATVTRNFTLFVQSLSAVNTLQNIAAPHFGDFVVGSSMYSVFSVNGGQPPYTVTQIGGTMPPGVAIVPANVPAGNSNFGRYALAGIPTGEGMHTVRLRYEDSSVPKVSVDRDITINITQLTVASSNPQPAVVNQPYSAQLYGLGGTQTHTFRLADILFNRMPPGLTLSPTGLISGTPTSTGSFFVTLDQVSGTLNRRLGVTITVNATTDGRRINFSFGPRVGDTPMGHAAIVVLQPTGGSGTHTWTLLSPLPPGMTLYSGASLPALSGQTAPSAVLAGAPTAPGMYNIKLRVDDSTGNFAVREGLLGVSVMRVGPQNNNFNGGRTVAPAKVGVPYNFQTTAVNGRTPLSFLSVGGTYLPPGITMSGTGVLSGTPTAAGNFTQNFLMTDANNQSQEGSFAVQVYPANQPIGVSSLSGANIPSATRGIAYAFNLDRLVLPGFGTPPFQWSLVSGSVPGLSIVGNQLTGVPTTNGAFPLDLMVQDANSTRHIAVSNSLIVNDISVSPAPGSSLAGGALNMPYSQAITVNGSACPCTLRLGYNSSLPVGLSFSSAGVLAGTPTTLGKFLIQLEAVDAANNIFPLRYIVDISGTPAAAITMTPSAITVNYTPGNPTPPSVPVSVGSTGAGFSFTAATSGGAWLGVAPGSGVAPSSVNVSFNTTGLAVGTYNGTLTVTSAGASNSPATIPVTLSVTGAVTCSYSLSTASATSSWAGGNLSFNVLTAPGCNWSASTPDNWITVVSPGSGTGSGAVNLNVAGNPTPSQRIGTVNAGGVNYTLTQFGTTCSFTVSPTSSSAPTAGGAGQITVTASASGCPWTATTAGGFITLGSSSGAGSGQLNFVVDGNSGAASRSGTISVNGQTHTVNQAGVGCTYTLSSGAGSYSSNADFVDVQVNAGPGCGWTADPGPAWLSASPSSGTGTQMVRINLTANSTTTTRAASVLIGGNAYQVTQAGVPCSFSVSSNSGLQPATGGAGTVDITANGTGCNWAAASNANWLAIANPVSGSGTGNGSISFNVGANGAAEARSATLTIAGQNLILNQSGLTCAHSLRSISGTSPSGGSSSSVGVVTAPGCAFSASSNSPFLSLVNGPNYAGTADVLFTVSSNTTGTQRSGTLTIAGQTFSVTQDPAACSITPSATLFSTGEFGGSSSFTYTTTVSSCPHTVQSYASWITINGGTSYSGTNGTVAFQVAANTYAAARSGTIRVGDVVFTVNQAPSTCGYTLLSTAPAGPFSRLGGDGVIPMSYAPSQCGQPPVMVNGPPGMITLGNIVAGPGTYTQNYSVGIYQSFINYIRTADILINGASGQIFKVKQNSW